MIARILLVIVLMFNIKTCIAQITLKQYFDGRDTNANNSIFINFDTSSSNIWQIGKPQKIIFNSAATFPNALVTDTLHAYPSNNVSRFSIGINHGLWSWGIGAIQWKQKLDLDAQMDGGIIEYSTDTGTTWHNVFNNPYIYNFYGFDSINKDTLPNGDYAFTGTDTSWKDIWLCFDASYFHTVDTLILRFTLKTDTVDNLKEGWLIDNILFHRTMIHTVVKTIPDSNYLKVYPTITTGIVNILAEKLQRYHIIESMQLYDMQGRLVQQFGISPTKFFIDISHHPNGTYYLKINTNLKSQTFPVILKK